MFDLIQYFIVHDVGFWLQYLIFPFFVDIFVPFSMQVKVLFLSGFIRMLFASQC